MPGDSLVKNWHGAIISESEEKLGRPLTEDEKRFIDSREGFLALEMIEDTVRQLTGSDLERYLNSERLD